MLSATNLIGALAVLLLSARVDAFSMCPLAKSPASCRRTGMSHATAVLARARGTTAASGLWVGASEKPRRSALRMAEDATIEIDLSDLEEREFQLEELEDRDVAATSVTLKKDGSVEAGATNGPLPLSARGNWSLEGGKFSMEISREFDAAIPYTVARVYTGSVDEVLPATDTVIISGDIVMEGMDVGFFKMISAPSDILDSLEHIDEKMTKRAA